MLSVKVSSKHQIAVPGEVRRALGIKAGDRLGVEVSGDVIVLRPRVPTTATRLRGTGRGIYGPDPVAYVRALRDEWEDRLDPSRE
ncbi:MAG: AbrB/MazE/SpoVT family DNA-binding domain-containing protein [Candidatus Limnocylindrales bacterium]